MRIDTAFPSNYLRAADLQGKLITVAMSHVNMEDIGSDHKPVLYFQGKEKGLVLNKTNATVIQQAYGADTEDWQGQPVTLFDMKVDFQGRMVDSIRVRIPPRTRSAQPQRDFARPPQQPENLNGHHDDDAAAAAGSDSIPF